MRKNIDWKTLIRPTAPTHSWRETMTMEDQVRQALARGYCHPDNSHKELDAKLIEAMTQEVVKSLTPDVVPGHQ